MTDRNLDIKLAEKAARDVAEHFPGTDVADVQDVFKYGSVTAGTISDDYDEAKSDAITEALDALGVEVL